MFNRLCLIILYPELIFLMTLDDHLESYSFNDGQEGGGVPRVNTGRMIPVSVTSLHRPMIFNIAAFFVVRNED